MREPVAMKQRFSRRFIPVMYSKYAENQGWRIEILSETEGEHGGYKEVICLNNGDGVYGSLKFESGAHRVQRVPATESQGRVHTSACTVAILPEIDVHTSVEINSSDLRIDTYRVFRCRWSAC